MDGLPLDAGSHSVRRRAGARRQSGPRGGMGEPMKSRYGGGLRCCVAFAALVAASAGCEALDTGTVAAAIEGQAWFVGPVGAGAS